MSIKISKDLRDNTVTVITGLAGTVAKQAEEIQTLRKAAEESAEKNASEAPDLSAKLKVVAKNAATFGFVSDDAVDKLAEDLSDPSRVIDHLNHAMKMASDASAALEAEKSKQPAPSLGTAEKTAAAPTAKTAMDLADEKFIADLSS